MVAHEVFHALKVHKRVSKSYMAVKTDISKAYDRIEWKFLEKVMRKKGFCELWISWIKKCASSITFLVMVNRYLFGDGKWQSIWKNISYERIETRRSFIFCSLYFVLRCVKLAPSKC